MQFQARQSSHDSADKVLARAMETAAGWGVDNALWQRPWTTLSGGEAQRVTLAIALGLDTAEVLLLDGEHRVLKHGQSKHRRSLRTAELTPLDRADIGARRRVYQVGREGPLERGQLVGGAAEGACVDHACRGAGEEGRDEVLDGREWGGDRGAATTCVATRLLCMYNLP